MARNTAPEPSPTASAQPGRLLPRWSVSAPRGPRNLCDRRRATFPMTQRINWSRDIYVTRCGASTCAARRGPTGRANRHARRLRPGCRSPSGSRAWFWRPKTSGTSPRIGIRPGARRGAFLTTGICLFRGPDLSPGHGHLARLVCGVEARERQPGLFAACAF